MQFRNLPSVDSVLSQEDVIAASQSFDRNWVVDIVREELETARESSRKLFEGALEDSSSMIRRSARLHSVSFFVLLCSLYTMHVYAWAVSYTHLTLPTNREV